MGISILGEIWIVPFLERTWVWLKKERENVGLPETQRERESVDDGLVGFQII